MRSSNQLADPSRARLRRGRVGTSLLFGLFGITLGVWTARIPAIKQGLHLTDPQLSIGLLTFAAGCITGMLAAGPVVDRLGTRAVLVPAAVAEGILLVPTAFAPNLATLGVALFVFGAGHGTLNVVMNADAMQVQTAWGRPIISSFHAVYSIGGFIGAGFGAVFAATGASARVTFLAAAALVLGLAVWASAWVLPTAKAASPGQRLKAAGVTYLGVLVFCCLVGEGAAADWSAVYLRDNLGSSAGFAPFAYAAFAIMMTVGRLVGDRLAHRFGAVALVRACALLAGAGLGLALLVGTPVAGVIGFGCLGAGLSCIAPQVFATAAARHPERAASAISRVASMGYAGFLAGPIVIGVAARAVPLPVALVLPVALALFVALAAPALKPPAKPPHPAVA
jgi:MFS family permease